MIRGRLILAVLAAMGCPAAGSAGDGLDPVLGQALFDRQTAAADGLGPQFDARSCADCHPGTGPGPVLAAPRRPLGGDSLILRLGRAGGAGDPVYGHQFNLAALEGQPAEGRAVLRWRNRDDGLRVPHITITRHRFGRLAAGTQISLRRAGSLRTVGLIASVPDTVILAQGGRPNWIQGTDGVPTLGRFGWKGAEPTLADQTARAFARDIGLSSPAAPAPWGDCTAAQARCRAGADSPGTAEITEEMLARVAHFLDRQRTMPRIADPAGRALFNSMGCAQCHATLTTADGTPAPIYSDLLLHDMGTGLADGLVEGSARGQDWRTAPLADLGASLARQALLHDGRARNADEAIRWHGGEAAATRDRYLALSPAERASLLAFLRSL